MPRFALWHRHSPAECPAVVAAWRGFAGPLRKAPAACFAGTHTMCWTVETGSAEAALGLLPEFVAERTEVVQVHEIVGACTTAAVAVRR